MTPEQKAKLDRLHELQGLVHKALGQMADLMGRIPETTVLTVSQEKWDQLFAECEGIRQRALSISDALEQSYNEAMQQGKS